jgi:uncharacterized protein GlcG (DUF336 family)
MADVTLAEATRACDVAIARAEDLGIKIAVAVVDSGTNLVAIHKMDGALILAIEGSRGKAVASVIFGQPSGELEVRADRPVMRALSIQMGGRFIMGQGAVPILRDGEVIGACGVGGGSSKEDEQCARAGAEAI